MSTACQPRRDGARGGGAAAAPRDRATAAALFCGEGAEGDGVCDRQEAILSDCLWPALERPRNVQRAAVHNAVCPRHGSRGIDARHALRRRQEGRRQAQVGYGHSVEDGGGLGCCTCHEAARSKTKSNVQATDAGGWSAAPPLPDPSLPPLAAGASPAWLQPGEPRRGERLRRWESAHALASGQLKLNRHIVCEQSSSNCLPQVQPWEHGVKSKNCKARPADTPEIDKSVCLLSAARLQRLWGRRPSRREPLGVQGSQHSLLQCFQTYGASRSDLLAVCQSAEACPLHVGRCGCTERRGCQAAGLWTRRTSLVLRAQTCTVRAVIHPLHGSTFSYRSSRHEISCCSIEFVTKSFPAASWVLAAAAPL
eukprot:268331-Chlamydomonas_euryale.AAC.4